MQNQAKQQDRSKSCPFPQDGLTRGYELAKGLDRLKFGLYVEFEDLEFFDILAQAKQNAQELREPVAMTFGLGDNFVYLVHTNGRKGGYNFHLSRADVNIFISTRKDWLQTPNVWVDVGSASCWSPGYNEVVTHVVRLIRKVKGKIHKNSVSEAHICVDLQQNIDDLELYKFNKWITRANDFNTYFKREKFSGMTLQQVGIPLVPSTETATIQDSGIELGKGDFMLRIYDKVLEISRNGAKNKLFAAVWGQDSFDSVAVTRTEFQLRKRVLREFRIKTLQQLFRKLSDVWHYCTHDWARFCSDAFDRKNRHQDRAIIHPFWQKLQQVRWIRPATNIQRKRVHANKCESQLSKMALGCSASIAVINGCKTADPEEVFSIVSKKLYKDIMALHRMRNPKTGETELQRKMMQKYLDLWTFSDSQLVGKDRKDHDSGLLHSYEYDLERFDLENDYGISTC